MERKDQHEWLSSDSGKIFTCKKVFTRRWKGNLTPGPLVLQGKNTLGTYTVRHNKLTNGPEKTVSWSGRSGKSPGREMDWMQIS